jgi:hypothetical protein
MPSLPRKRVLVPVVLLAVGFAGFKGYGAYTRSQPVDYSRGGDDFGTLVEATPTLGTTAASAAPTGKATAPAATGSPTALPRVDVTSAPTSVPVVTSVPRPQTVTATTVTPRVGSYPLAVTGSEKVQFGPVGFCSKTLPSRTALVVKPATGEAKGSFNFDVPYQPGTEGGHDERHIYRYDGSAVYLDYEQATVTCQGVRQSSATSFSPAQPRVRLPLQVGASWTYKGGGDSRTETSTFTVDRTETLTVAGERVLTYVIHAASSFSGDETGTRDQTWWYAPTWAMPIKWHDKQSGGRSGASYTGDITATVLSHP